MDISKRLKTKHGWEKFVERFGLEALKFTANKAGKPLKLRGLYARVVVDGFVAVGDRVLKIGRTL